MMKSIKKMTLMMLAMIMIISLCLGGIAIPASADGGGTVGIGARNSAPTITYNVRGADLGTISRERDGESENFHFYEEGRFEPGTVELWGTITNNLISREPNDIDEVFYRAMISYTDSVGKTHELENTGYIYIGPGDTVEYRFSDPIPDNAAHVRMEVVCVATWNAYARATVKADFYRPGQASVTPGEKTLGIDVPSGAPTITYNVKGINLGAIKDEVDGKAANKHYYDNGVFEPGQVEVWGTVRNNGAAGQNIFYNAMFKYKDAAGKEHKIETGYIDVGASYTADYRLSATIPEGVKNVYMEVVSVVWSNAYIRSTVSANLFPAPEVPAAPAVPLVPAAGSGAEAFESGARIMWQPADGIGYRLFRSTSKNALGMSATDFYITSTSYADVNVEPNTTYYYTVKPVLAEARPFEGIDEKLGAAIATFTVTTGDMTYKPGSYKHFIVLKVDSPLMSVDGISQEVDQGRGTTPLY
ncbi:MAG: hypothetical protein VB106_13160, partial [Clostridiaceae bacterium]|nr:hypothetical protein [Clostridiaceae bacterium]